MVLLIPFVSFALMGFCGIQVWFLFSGLIFGLFCGFLMWLSLSAYHDISIIHNHYYNTKHLTYLDSFDIPHTICA